MEALLSKEFRETVVALDFTHDKLALEENEVSGSSKSQKENKAG